MTHYDLSLDSHYVIMKIVLIFYYMFYDRFYGGASKYMSVAKSSAAALGQMSMNATRVEAQKYLSLCFQVMLCLGIDGSILPNTVIWSDTHIQRGNMAKKMNVSDVVLHALSTSIEAGLCMKCKDPTVKDIVHIQLLLRSAVLHALRLFALKQGLLNIPVKHYAGVKFHGLFYHVGRDIIRFGAPSFYDTARFEHAHIADGVLAFRRTSKRKLTQESEMLNVSIRRRRNAIMESIYKNLCEEVIIYLYVITMSLSTLTLSMLCH